MMAFFESTRRTLAILIGFFIPISTALTNILCPLAFLLILVEGQYKQKFNTLRHNSIALLALLLIVVMLLGFFYTPVSFSEAGLMLDKYREFFYISLFILIFRDSKSRQWGVYAFLGAMGVTLFLSYLMAVTGWKIGKGIPENPFVFKNHITQGILMALAAYFVAVQCWKKSRQWRWLRGFVILLAIYNIVFMSEGRSGYLVLFCLILLFFYQTYRLRGILIGGVGLALFSILVYTSSNVLHQRINQISEDVQYYQQGNSETSTGKRIEFYQNSLRLFSQNPLLGAGTGSFSYQYKQLAASQNISPSTNPHNEYLMIAVQWGLIGVGLFIYLFYLMWQTTYHLKTQPALMAQGLVVTITVGCLVNSLWLDNTEGHLFAYLIGVFYSGLMPTYSPQHNLLKKQPYEKQIIAIIIVIFLALVSYRTFTVPKIPASIDKQLAVVMLNNIKTVTNGKAHSAIGLDTKGTTTIVDAKFESVIKTKAGISGNNLVLSTSNDITASTQIQVAPRHVGKAAHIVIIASHQTPTQTNFLQRSGLNWEKLDITRLKSAQSFSYLPANIDLVIYQGSLGMVGNINVFVAYVLEDNTLVLNTEPMRVQIKSEKD